MARTTKSRTVSQLRSAVLSFLTLLLPDHGGPTTKAEDYVCRLAWAAFRLYQHEWGDESSFNIREWHFPADELKELAPFTCNENPWTVLLRRAYELSR